MITRLARADDLHDIVPLMEAFANESEHVGVWDYTAATEYAWGYICDEDADIIVVEDEEELVAFAMLALSPEVYTKPLCYIGKFYVNASHRGTRASRDLAASITTWSGARDVTATFTTATGGLDDRSQALFINLMKRNGFAECGPVMVAQ